MTTPSPRLSRRSAMAALLALALTVVVAPAVTASPTHTGARLMSRLPGSQVEVRAGHREVQTAPILPRASVRRGGPPSATIEVEYNGFSAKARAAFQVAVDIWEARVVSPRTIHVTANWTPMGAGVLGAAGPTAFYFLSDGFVYPAALAEALCDCQGGAPIEISANFNSSFPDWYLGTDGTGPASKYDFLTVVLHELGHGLGFLSTFSVAGRQGGWGLHDGSPPPMYATRYDVNERSARSGGNKLTKTQLYPNPSATLRTQLTDGSVFFGGAEVVAQNGGRAKLYAPKPWQAGSSNSHFDEAAFPTGSADALMTPFLDNGEVLHAPGALTLALFRDIGWSTNPGS
ncbi:hypothetical protein BH18CHL1_BH18CHL1_07760 [soil metagenome]